MPPALIACNEASGSLRYAGVFGSLIADAATRNMNNVQVKNSVASFAALAVIGTALWVGLVLLFAAPLPLTSSVSWREAVRFGVSFWALWLALLPCIGWLCFRFPIESRKLFRVLGIHLVVCLLVVGANRVAFRVVDKLAPRAQRTVPSGPPAAFGVLISFRAALDVLVYWSLVGACQAIVNFRKSQERARRAAELEARLTSAKLQALRMQLNPHFLFNTLNSVAALVYLDPRAADEMLGDLSELLRRSLDSMEEQEIPLAHEFEFIRKYLSIEQIRLGDRLRVEERVPEELLKAFVPALILQPLIENAIRHGIEPNRGPGRISIEAVRQDQRLHLVVRDNGSGVGHAPDDAGRRGIGIANSKARLEALYGSAHRFEVANVATGGCEVTIHLPLHYEPLNLTTTSQEVAG